MPPSCKQSTGPHPASIPSPMPPAHKAVRDDEPVNPISNAPVLAAPEEADALNPHRLEIFRLRRRVAELECAVRDRDDYIRRAINVIEDQLQFWRTFLHDHVGETLGGIMRRVGRLESALAYMKERGGHHVPALEIPPAFRRKSESKDG